MPMRAASHYQYSSNREYLIFVGWHHQGNLLFLCWITSQVHVTHTLSLGPCVCRERFSLYFYSYKQTNIYNTGATQVSTNTSAIIDVVYIKHLV